MTARISACTSFADSVVVFMTFSLHSCGALHQHHAAGKIHQHFHPSRRIFSNCGSIRMGLHAQVQLDRNGQRLRLPGRRIQPQRDATPRAAASWAETHVSWVAWRFASGI